MRWISPVLILVSLCIIGCSGTNTQDLLDTKFISPTTIELLSPSTGSVSTPSVTFTYSQRVGIADYQLQIAETANFSNIVFRKFDRKSSITITPAEFAFEPREYFWRVSDKNQGYMSEIRSLQIVSTDTVFVNPNFSGATQIGNKSAPFRSIQAGINDALARRPTATTPMQVLVSRDGNSNGTTDDIVMAAGIALKGGYDADNNWSRNIAINVTTIRTSYRYGVLFESDVTSAYTGTTVLEGFHVESAINSRAAQAIRIRSASPTIRYNNLRSFPGGQSSATVLVNVGAPVIHNNSIQVSGGSYGYALWLGSASGALVYNNTVFAFSGSNHIYGIAILAASNATISNNTVLCANVITGGSYDCYGISLAAATAHKPSITNNLVIPLLASPTGVRASIYEDASTTPTPGSVENNFLLNAGTGANFSTFRRNAPVTQYTDLTFEGLTAWTSGNDKARGNMTTAWASAGGLVSLPFENTISHLPISTNGSSGNNFTMTVSAGNAANLANADLIELGGDGIPRRITCAGACGTSITFTPALAGATSIGSGTTIRVFRNNALASACFSNSATQGKFCNMFDYRLKRPAAATDADWDSIRSGGKNTALAVCGEPESGPGIGAGAQTCGSVATDAAGVARTATVPGSSAHTNGAFAAGISVGAFEAD